MTDAVPHVPQAPRGGAAIEIPSARARSFPPRALLFLGLAVMVVLLDQATKRLAEERLDRAGVRSVPLPFVGDYLRFTYVENRGAAFGLLQDQPLFFAVVGS